MTGSGSCHICGTRTGQHGFSWENPGHGESKRVDIKGILADPDLRQDLLDSMYDPGPDDTHIVYKNSEEDCGCANNQQYLCVVHFLESLDREPLPVEFDI